MSVSQPSFAEVQAEQQYQNALLATVFGKPEKSSDPFNTCRATQRASLSQGLAVYHNNGAANAVRALASLHPAVQACLGEGDFYAVAKAFWLNNPPTRGDWAQHTAAHGFDFGAWLASSNYGGVLTALPFLADLARLDDAIGTAQDVADIPTNLASLSLLDQDPSGLYFQLHPSVGLLHMDYDVLDFRHNLLAENVPTLNTTTPTNIFNAVKLKAPISVLIHRQDWRGHAVKLDAASAVLLQRCMAGDSLAQAHNAACVLAPAFEFATWLSHMLQW
jgi:Putative DNA-binding domain